MTRYTCEHCGEFFPRTQIKRLEDGDTILCIECYKKTLRTTRKQDDPEFTEDEVNNIIEQQHSWSRYTANKKILDVFNLHMVVFVGNTKDGQWDIREGAYMMFVEHSIRINIDSFWDCYTVDEVVSTFSEVIGDRMKEEV